MMSLRLLRALVRALVGLIQAFVERPRTIGVRAPSFGPAGPWARHLVAALHPPRAPTDPPPRRPAPVRAPPHIIALLAQAPDVEPEFAALRVPRPPDAAHASALTAPELAPESEPPRVKRRHRHGPTWVAGLTLRLSRGCRAVAEWLVFDAPPPARA